MPRPYWWWRITPRHARVEHARSPAHALGASAGGAGGSRWAQAALSACNEMKTIYKKTVSWPAHVSALSATGSLGGAFGLWLPAESAYAAAACLGPADGLWTCNAAAAAAAVARQHSGTPDPDCYLVARPE